jgi:hypothetical protein
MTYMAAGSLKKVDVTGLVFSPHTALDFVARQTPPGRPADTIIIKIGGIYRLSCNFSLDRQLVKNVQVVVVGVGFRLITVRLIHANGMPTNEDIFIP